MSKKQRLVLAIFVPIVIFFIALTIANYIGVTVIYRSEKVSFYAGGHEFTIDTKTKNYNPFDLEKTWYVWLLFSIFVCIFEYKLFGNKKMIINKKKNDDLI